MKNPWLWRRDGVGWGRVCIRGTGIQAAVVFDRWQAGEAVNALALDYDVPSAYVVAAINFELGRRNRRTKAWREALEKAS